MIWTTLDITNDWYWLLMALFATVGIVASWVHNKAMPALWGVAMAIVLYVGAPALEPLIFGFMYYPTYSAEWILTGAFTVLFLTLNGAFLYYAAKYGHVHEKLKPGRKNGALTGFLTVLSIAALVMPVAVSGYVEAETVNNILEVQGTYPTGHTFGLYDGNISETMTTSPFGYTINDLGFDPDNDTIFIGVKGGGAPSTSREYHYYGDYMTYVGGGNHTAVVDWSDVPVGDYLTRYIFIPLNMTCGELAEYDFIRTHNDIVNEGYMYQTIWYQTDTSYQTIDPIKLDVDSNIYPIAEFTRSALRSNENGTVYYVMYGGYLAFDETQTSFTWQVESVKLDAQDYAFGYQFTDMTVWVMTMMFLDTVYLLAVVFATPWFDTTYDKRK